MVQEQITLERNWSRHTTISGNKKCKKLRLSRLIILGKVSVALSQLAGGGDDYYLVNLIIVSRIYEEASHSAKRDTTL